MKNLLWLDLEMTGLDDLKDRILEVAAVVTDMDFNVRGELHRVIFQPAEVLERMNDWCKTTHGASGLTRAVALGAPLPEVEKELIVLLDRFFDPKDRVVLCGNSIGNDRRFVDRYLPEVAKRLHYRMIDVSSFKEIFREKYGISVKKSDGHRALDDVRESIRELQTYLSYVKIGEKAAQ